MERRGRPMASGAGRTESKRTAESGAAAQQKTTAPWWRPYSSWRTCCICRPDGDGRTHARPDVRPLPCRGPPSRRRDLRGSRTERTHGGLPLPAGHSTAELPTQSPEAARRATSARRSMLSKSRSQTNSSMGRIAALMVIAPKNRAPRFPRRSNRRHVKCSKCQLGHRRLHSHRAPHAQASGTAWRHRSSDQREGNTCSVRDKDLAQSTDGAAA